MDKEILYIFLRTILILGVLFVLTKLMGKKQLSQLNIYDYLIGITIGNVAAEISIDIDKNIIGGVICLITYVLFYCVYLCWGVGCYGEYHFVKFIYC